MKQEYKSWGQPEKKIVMPVTPPPAPKKALTFPEIVEELKKQIIQWGGEVYTKEEYMTGGKVKEITLTAKFRVP